MSCTTCNAEAALTDGRCAECWESAGDALEIATAIEAARSFVGRFVYLTADQLDAVGLWVLHTYFIDAAHATPYLSITSAEKESGKTRLLEVLNLIVARSWFTGRISSAVLARKVDDVKPTLLLDEFDAAQGSGDEYSEAVRGLLNTGYRRGGVSSLCVGQGANIAYKDFSTFCAKAIAGIGDLPDTVESRSIKIQMKRRAPGEAVERFRDRKVRPAAELIAATFEELSANVDLVEKLAAAEPELPETIGDRACDSWEPLIAIADLAGGEWPDRVRKVAERLSAHGAPDESTLGVRLLDDCRTAFEDRDIVPATELLDYLHGLDESPWADWYGKPVSARKIADILKRYEIKSKVRRVDNRTPRTYLREQFEDAWRRYLPSYGDSIRNKRNNGLDKPETALLEAQHSPQMLRVENGNKPHEQANVADVADSDPNTRENEDLGVSDWDEAAA